MPRDPDYTYETPHILHDLPLDDQEPAHFHFDDFAARLARLAAEPETHTPLTIGISGPWGSGKTTLLKRIQQMLEQPIDSKTKTHRFANSIEEGQRFRKCKTVWFEAWKYSAEDHLLAALVRAIAFGSGIVGDFGCHTGNVMLRALRLDQLWNPPAGAKPGKLVIRVQAKPSEVDQEGYPTSMVSVVDLPARGVLPPVKLTLYAMEKPAESLMLGHPRGGWGDFTNFCGRLRALRVSASSTVHRCQMRPFSILYSMRWDRPRESQHS